ncbi:MAG: methyl-accepting chemotaxis protein [Desulfobacteraceae bacterium]|jgi:methyl-accepting chemotaxis protein
MKNGQQMTARIATVNRTANDEILRLAEAMVNGLLDERGNPDEFEDEDRKLITLVNRMLDALVTPLRLAASAIDKISHGTIPPFLIDDYKGEYNDIKLNLNTLLATLYGLDNETRNLIDKIKDGQLRTRGNDWDFSGIWRNLINGVNGTLDAVIDPVSEAGVVLSKLASFDLRARMHGQYKGEHAMIKKAINGTAESLHSAIAQVAESVESVTEVGNRIAMNSLTVERGAEEQNLQVSEASLNLSYISESSAKTVKNTESARKSAQQSVQSINGSKKAMERMLQAMDEIRSAAENTTAIVQEIDIIAKETDVLASSGAEKALVVRSSSGGFGVVATEIRVLAKRCHETAERLDKFGLKIHIGSQGDNDEAAKKLKNDFDAIIADLMNVSKVSHYLGLNASVAAAHVGASGDRFEIMTDEIGRLAKRSADAARRTEELIRHSVDYARKGEELSKEIDSQLAGAVQGGNTINKLTEEISTGSQEQARGLDEIIKAVEQINQVTKLNTSIAHESAESVSILETETKKLSQMVSKFSIDREAGANKR